MSIRDLWHATYCFHLGKSMNALENLKRCRVTVLEMLTDRGYTIPPDVQSLDVLTLDANQLAQQAYNIHLEEPRKCYVRFILLAKLRPNALKEQIQDIHDNHLAEGEGDIILISRSQPSTTLVKIVKATPRCQIFWMDKLLVNITKHKLVPKHELIEPCEVERILKKFSIASKNQLPVILKEDPISQYFGYPTGAVCKVTRTSATAGEYVSYRYVK